MGTKVVTVPEILAAQPSDVSLQGDIIRCRIPSSILTTVEAEVGDAIDWQTLSSGSEKYIVGVVIKGGAKGRKPATHAATPTKAATKKSAAKKGGKKSGVKAPQVKAGDLEGAFDEAEDWGDDAPTLPVRAAAFSRPASKKGISAPSLNAGKGVKPVPARAKGGKYDVPTRPVARR